MAKVDDKTETHLFGQVPEISESNGKMKKAEKQKQNGGISVEFVWSIESNLGSVN